MHVRFHAVYVKSLSNITVRAKTKCSWDLRHINLRNTQQNYKVLHTRGCTSRRITLGCFASHSRKSESLSRVLNTFFCCRTLFVIETCDANLVSTLLSMAALQSIFVSVMKSWAIVWCRANGFPFRETQVKTLSTLSKQSRKKGSFHSISEAGASPMRLACILMDSFDHPTFFKKTSSCARPSFSLPWQLQHDTQCAPQMVCTFAASSKRFPGPGGTGRGWAWKSS